ncbi:MAG: hypothetical protein HY877_00145 [Deltaproteobacteria bacterium]|nr:hypothetical protein [Deltaproteobacteria bacterium]
MRNLFDGNPHTAWVEGIPGSGIGITWEIGSNIRELTFQKIKVVNGYAKDKTTFENNNRIREIVIFSPFTKPQTIKFDDSPEIQIVSLKEPFKAPAIVFMIKSVYKGKKYDDTGLSELRFITQELEEWPTPPNNVIETYSFVSPPNFLLEWDAYTYPSYDIYAEGIERGNIASDFLSFDMSSSGWAFVTENSEAEAFSLLYLPDVKGPVDIHWTHLFLDKIDSFEQTVTEEKSSTSLGWFERDQLCVMKEDHDAPTTFFVYQIENKKLKLKKTVQIPLGQTEHLWKDNEKKFSLGGKYQILFRSFCPVSKN